MSIKSYADIALHTDVETASPHRLVALLLERCLKKIHQTKEAILHANIQQKFKAAKNVQEIVSYLRMCLNVEDKNAQELSKQLDSVYQYLEHAIFKASLENKTDHLDSAYKALSNIKTGWDGIA